MRVLLTGASGLLGKYLIDTQPPDAEITPTYFQHRLQGGIHVDLMDAHSIYYAFNRSEPEVVIHCAGNADVDWCQRNRSEAIDINIGGTEILCEAAVEYGARVVYLSTNAVFDGQRAPYSEGDPCEPVNFYGTVKLSAEGAIQRYDGRWTIVRPILLYGWPWPWGRQNWVTRVLAAKGRKALHVVDDTVTQPTFAGWCAKAIWKLVRGEYDGIYHLGGADTMSLWQFCTLCAEVWGGGVVIHKAASADFPSIAPRPHNTTYDVSKIKEIGIEPVTARAGLYQMKEQLR